MAELRENSRESYLVLFSRDKNGFNYEIHGKPDTAHNRAQIIEDLLRAADQLKR